MDRPSFCANETNNFNGFHFDISYGVKFQLTNSNVIVRNVKSEIVLVVRKLEFCERINQSIN